MKHNINYKRFMAALLLIGTSALSWAQDFQVDGLYYEKNEDGKSVSVTCKYEEGWDGGLDFVSNTYKGKNEITIPSTVTHNGTTYNVTGIIGAFYDCEDLTSVTIPNSVTKIDQSAFLGCTDLESITIPNSVTVIGDYAFNECSSLESITIPNSVTEIGERAFWECSSLTSVTIGDGVTKIGKGAFWECSSLASVTIGNSVTRIGESAFLSCKNLKSVTIPNSVTRIDKWAFAGCYSLTSVTIGNGITRIGEEAFGECKSLMSVTCLAEKVPNTHISAFDDTPFGTLYVPAASVNAYKAAKPWSDFERILPKR